MSHARALDSLHSLPRHCCATAVPAHRELDATVAGIHLLPRHSWSVTACAQASSALPWRDGAAAQRSSPPIAPLARAPIPACPSPRRTFLSPPLQRCLMACGRTAGNAAARAHVASSTTTRWRRLRCLRPLLCWSPPTHIQHHFLIGRSGMLLHWFGSRRLKRPRFLAVTRSPKSTGQRRHQSSCPRSHHLGHSSGTQLLTSLHPRVVPLECPPPHRQRCPRPHARGAVAAARGTAWTSARQPRTLAKLAPDSTH